MTEQEVIQLSNEVAKLYSVKPFTFKTAYDSKNVEFYEEVFWLVDDWQRLMPLAIEHGICVDPSLSENVYAVFSDKSGNDVEVPVRRTKHPTKERAVAVAILKALKAKKEK